uniref:PAS domain-containing protein n=1 Tax=Enterococcus faecalis TaxID=1351 RepID=UPI0040416DF8
ETTESIAAGLAAETADVSAEEHYDWENETSTETIVLPTGTMKLEEMIALFQVLPVDLTFVDKEDRVRFFSEGKSRVFPRTKSVIGREVVNCHPPKSMHIVQQILDDFRSGVRTEADFWIDMRGKKIYIRYFALKNESNDYLGCLEVTQDITDIQAIEGHNRLLEGKTN